MTLVGRGDQMLERVENSKTGDQIFPPVGYVGGACHGVAGPCAADWTWPPTVGLGPRSLMPG